MRRVWRGVAVSVAGLSALIGAVPISVAAGGERVADSVRLAFRWPENLSGTVTYELNKTRRNDGETRNFAYTGSYRLRTAPVADGLLVRADEVRIGSAGDPRPSSAESRLQEFLFRSSSMPPGFVVGRDGRFLRLQGVDRFQRGLRTEMGRMVGDLPASTQLRFAQAMTPLMSRAQLEANIVAHWNRDVGAWLGADLHRGGAYKQWFTSRIPAFGELEVPMVSTFRFLRRVPCAAGGPVPDCVELMAETRVDSDALARALEHVLTRLDGDRRAPVVRAFRLNSTVRLITEPKTLIPHRVRSRKESAAVIALGEDIRRSEQVVDMQLTYRYLGARSGPAPEAAPPS